MRSLELELLGLLPGVVGVACKNRGQYELGTVVGVKLTEVTVGSSAAVLGLLEVELLNCAPRITKCST